MEDDTTSESESETYEVEYSASELYALHGLLRYLTFELDGNKEFVAQTLAKNTHEVMASNGFNDAMDDEIDRVEEQMQDEFGSMPGGGFGTNVGGFQ